MFNPLFDGDSVEALAQTIVVANDRDAIHAFDFPRDDIVGSEESVTELTKHLEQCTVGELPANLRANSKLIKPLLQSTAEIDVTCGKQKGRAVQRLGKSFAISLCQILRSEKCDPAFAQEMIISPDAETRIRGDVA